MKIGNLTNFKPKFFSSSIFISTFVDENIIINLICKNMNLEETYKQSIASLLPDHTSENENFDYSETAHSRAQQAYESKQQKMNAPTLAKMKLAEKQRLRNLNKQLSRPAQVSEKDAHRIEEEKKITEQNIAELEVIESSPEAQNFLAGEGHSDLSPYAGTTKRDVVKMLDSLGINLNMYLTRADTYNLLSCLLTCNEAQLEALYKNPKVPLAIKTVIKRLQEDSRLGNIETIEKLWDRIFGKADKAKIELPAGVIQQGTQIQGVQGIIPNTVVSREAYMIIRDTIIGK